MPKIALRSEHGPSQKRRDERLGVQSVKPISALDTHRCSQSGKGFIILSNQRPECSVCSFGLEKVTRVKHLYFLSSLQGLSHESPAVV